jgi:hypothetical protein
LNKALRRSAGQAAELPKKRHLRRESLHSATELTQNKGVSHARFSTILELHMRP